MPPRVPIEVRIPSARPRRSCGYSSTTIVTAAAHSAPRNTCARNWATVYQTRLGAGRGERGHDGVAGHG